VTFQTQERVAQQPGDEEGKGYRQGKADQVVDLVLHLQHGGYIRPDAEEAGAPHVDLAAVPHEDVQSQGGDAVDADQDDQVPHEVGYPQWQQGPDQRDPEDDHQVSFPITQHIVSFSRFAVRPGGPVERSASDSRGRWAATAAAARGQ